MTAVGTAPMLGRALVWFRRDLRDFDHAALSRALGSARSVFTAFVFDREILDALPSAADRRVEFIWDSVRELDTALRAHGGGLIVRHARARDEIPALAAALGVDAVFANHDYEPAAMDRDAAVAHDLADRGISFVTTRDQVIFERDEVRSLAGKPFSVFTPYKNAWLKALTPARVAAHPVARLAAALARPPRALDQGLPSLEAMGFARTNLRGPGRAPGNGRRRGALRRLQAAHRRLRRGAQLSGGEGTVVPFGASALRHRVGARTRRVCACAVAPAGRRGRGDLAVGAHLARLLRADPVASPARRRRRLQARVRCAALSRRPLAAHRLEGGSHRVSAGRRGDAATRLDRLHAQPAADGQLPRSW